MKRTTLVLLSALAGAGCTTNTTKFSSVKSTPTNTKTSLSNALSCASTKLGSHNSDVVYAIFVRNIIDGTVRTKSSADGPLSDAGKLQLSNRLVELIPSEDALIVDSYPLIFRANNKGTIGLSRFGVPPTKDTTFYRQRLLKQVNSTRIAKKLPPAKMLTLMVVDGAFTRIDSTAFGNNGYGLDLGNDGTRGSGDIDYGSSASKKVVSLDVNLIRPDLNALAVSESLDLEFSSATKKFGITTSVGEGDLGFSISNTEIESVHSAQQTLIDASALWIVNKLYSKAKTSTCMPSKTK